MDIKRIVIIVGIVAVCLADSHVSLNCNDCGSELCFQLYGGGFDGYTYVSNGATGATCSQTGIYPVLYTFTCSHSQCEQGCAITTDRGDTRSVACS